MAQELKTVRRAAMLLAAAAAALGAMGADKAPVSDAAEAAKADAAIERLFPTPRLYRVTMTGTLGRRGDGAEMCLGAAVVRKLMADVSQPAAAKGGPTQAAATRGCTLRTQVGRGDGSFRIELSCDKATGAARTVHLVIEGARRDIRQHLELVIDDPASDAPRIVSSDMHMTDAGPCPVNMKPGQFRGPNGEITDPPAPPAKSAPGR